MHETLQRRDGRRSTVTLQSASGCGRWRAKARFLFSVLTDTAAGQNVLMRTAKPCKMKRMPPFLLFLEFANELRAGYALMRSGEEEERALLPLSFVSSR